MRTLHNLKAKLKKPNERVEDTATPTFLDICVDSLMQMRGESGIDSIRNYQLAEKLIDLPEPFDIEDAEMERLNIALEQNRAGYLSWAHGQTMLKAQEWRQCKPGE
jgi:hypothetical protein